LAIASSFRLLSLVGPTAGRMCDGRSFFTRRGLPDFHHVRGHYPRNTPIAPTIAPSVSLGVIDDLAVAMAG
jgi:hypothetical protein